MQRLFLLADLIDRFRLVPRLIVTGYAIALWQVVQWYMDNPDPSGNQTAFVSTMVGAAAAFFGFYVNSGGKHDS